MVFGFLDKREVLRRDTLLVSQHWNGLPAARAARARCPGADARVAPSDTPADSLEACPHSPKPRPPLLTASQKSERRDPTPHFGCGVRLRLCASATCAKRGTVPALANSQTAAAGGPDSANSSCSTPLLCSAAEEPLHRQTASIALHSAPRIAGGRREDTHLSRPIRNR
jgi:hypothetical protein